MFKSKFQIIIEGFVLSALTMLKIFIKSKLLVRLDYAMDASKCTILTNGPSLIPTIESTKSIIKTHDLICVNHFPTTPLYEELKPKYFITTAPDLWLDDIEERFIIQRDKLFTAMATKTTWSLTLLVPFEARGYKKWQQEICKNENIRIVYFNNTPVEGYQWFERACFKLKLGMPRPHNVLIPCLTLALRMGYKSINILGADHSWLPEISVTQDNDVLIRQKHFYDQENVKAMPQDKKGKGKRRLFELLEKYLYTFRGYFTLKEYAEHLNASILNVTDDSFIDAFDKSTAEEFIRLNEDV